MPFSIVPLLLLIVPLAEIGAFIVIGREIGVFWTLAMVFFTAVLGSILLRVQGFGLVRRIQQEMEAGRVPGRELVHGVMIMIAGVLLLTPGFITDAIGFLLFVPAIRDAGWAMIKSRFTVVHAGGFGSRGFERDRKGSGPGTIDLDEADFKRDPDPDSPWNKEGPDGKDS
ncbi:FxsA family protein [Hoeflea prorocentri]|uniref:Membrane protein FxsA n=1 Tax=Hoeflea prorocentri TaxID=1922333 RepID=A0A9X3ZJ70_9HYPH|nr:FxsA family protein [Hoeflea prorocentri]MCY6383159.1 membrane protein FxsA [Hoeflea prorocentri]MDA5400959.1 membrane protein FxsA [Hoeflea prorocentri]